MSSRRFHNPLRLRMDAHGRLLDKYGRVFEYSPALKRKVRKTRHENNVSVLSHVYGGHHI